MFTFTLSLTLLRFISNKLSVMSEEDFPVPGVLVLTPSLGVTLDLLEGVLDGVDLGVGVAPGPFLAGEGV